jgi:hypothetical protein
MICTHDGHVEVSISNSNIACKHDNEKKKKSCCDEPKKQAQAKVPEDCCNHSASYLKLEIKALSLSIYHWIKQCTIDVIHYFLASFINTSAGKITTFLKTQWPPGLQTNSLQLLYCILRF